MADLTNNDWQKAEITHIHSETANVKSFRLKPGTWFSYRAGQHLDIRLTAPDGYQAQRSYSLASAPTMHGYYELAVERLVDGEVSPYFHDVAQIGDSFEIRGPFGGHFVWPDDNEPILLIGGGSGIVPLISMVRYRATNNVGLPTMLLYGARTWEDVIFRDELIAYQKSDEAFGLVLALSRGSSLRTVDFNTRIDQQIITQSLASFSSRPKTAFICGANRFVEAIAQFLISDGIDADAIRTERFGGS